MTLTVHITHFIDECHRPVNSYTNSLESRCEGVELLFFVNNFIKLYIRVNYTGFNRAKERIIPFTAFEFSTERFGKRWTVSQAWGARQNRDNLPCLSIQIFSAVCYGKCIAPANLPTYWHKRFVFSLWRRMHNSLTSSPDGHYVMSSGLISSCW